MGTVSSRNGTVEPISIWAETVGADPSTHFWFVGSDSVPRRICDGRERVASSGIFDLPNAPCLACKGIYLEDVTRGRQVLTILPDPPESVVYPSESVVYPPESVVSSHQEDIMVPEIPLAMFANFYEVRPAQQVKIVRDIRTRLANREGYRSRDYYWALRNTLRQTHWKSGNIADFENALGPLVHGTQLKQRAEHYRVVGEAYIEFWKQSDASFFSVPPSTIEIEGLPLRVRPEIGRRRGRDSEVLKLWMNGSKPSRQTRQVMDHLMELARGQEARWSNDWQVGILDVRRRDVPRPITPARDFRLGLAGQIAAFLHVWERLDATEEFE